MSYLYSLCFVAIGGAVGACSRFAISEVAVVLLGRGFPYGTLTVNILGSALMGMLFALMAAGVIAPSPWRQLVGLGFLGALTTFSSFSMDNLLLLQQGEWLKTILNMALNLGLCMLAVAAGFYLTQKLAV